MTNIVAIDRNAIANLRKFAGERQDHDITYMKFTKEGHFVVGQEGAIIDDDERFAVDMRELKKGFICWKEGSPAGEEMGLVLQGQEISRADLDDIPGSDGWQEQYSLILQSLDSHEKFQFKTSTKGGCGAIQDLVTAFLDRFDSGSTAIVPVVCLVDDPYKHKTFGKIHKPKFVIQEWLEPASAAAHAATPATEEDDLPFDIEDDEPQAPAPGTHPRRRRTAA